MPALGFPLGMPIGGSTLTPGAVITPTTPNALLSSFLTPTGQDFGADVLVFPGLDESMTPVADGRVLGEAIARRFLTPKGSLPFHPDYGIDIRDYLNDAMTRTRLFAIKAEMEIEARGDERVNEANIDVSFDAVTKALTAKISLVTEEGPYSLTLLVSQLSIQILQG